MPTQHVSEDGFVAPDFSGTLDFARAHTLVQPGATVKGMQMKRWADECARLGKPLDRTFIAFKDYSGHDLLDVMEQALPRMFPGLGQREAVRRLGHLAYATMSDSMAGRVLLAALNGSIGRSWALVSKAYTMSASTGRVDVVDSGPQHAVLRYDGMYSFIDVWHPGILEGVMKALNRVGRVRVKLRSPTAADMWVDWT